MKSHILKIAMCAVFALCAQQASADIKDFFQKGEQVTIGDSIKGRMIRYSTQGKYRSVYNPDYQIPSECRIVLQETKNPWGMNYIWFENLFPAQSENHYHKWVRGYYKKNAEFKNPLTDTIETRDVLIIEPFYKVDYKIWFSNGSKYGARLRLRIVAGPGLPKTYGGHVENAETEEGRMASYIRFIIEDDMSLTAVNAIGEGRTILRKYYNFEETTPYGIDLDNLPYNITESTTDIDGYIRDLKLIPQ